MVELGMHTDNWRTLSGSFELGIDKAVEFNFKHVEFGVVHGHHFITSMGYEPSISMQTNPRALRRYLEEKGLQVSQIDASFPLMCPEGATYGVAYLQQAIRFASEINCPMVDTSDGAVPSEDLSEDEVFRLTCQNYHQCLRWAEDYGVIITVEPHGPYTNNGDFLERLFTHFDSEYLQFNMDTGNTFIAGNDPLKYLQRFRKYLRHMHIKDVSQELAAAARGEDTGIGCSQAPIGQGVNAENIRRCLDYLSNTGWEGVGTIECLGSDENLKSSIGFLNGVLRQPVAV